ncbi:MAG: pyruvate dehydrogenase complex dihydrolipoamide acetyltransferase [Saprospiraceae bacterium]|nr:pyruvate dehydrogenase complex dihydrolipoamide acetyltransferase [Saprospiraceae bacterium]
MAEIIRMPRLSDTMEEGNIVAWLKKVGEVVKPGDILAEVETDKATMELESYFNGTLLYVGLESGPVPVDGIIAIIGKPEEDYKSILAAAQAGQPAAVSAPAQPAPAAETASKSQMPEVVTEQPAPVANAEETRLKASPLAKSLANKSGVDLAAVKGSGDHGRIIKKDVEQFMANPTPAIMAPTTFSTTQAQPLPSGEIPVTQMRKIIAKRLGESMFTAPHFYLTMEIDMSNAMDARSAINEDGEVKISFNDFVVKACAVALRKHPMVNSSWMGDKIAIHNVVNIGVAVAVPDGLLVPVVNEANTKSLSQINKEVKELAAKAKDKKLQPQEMQGNTFTISNLGMFDIEEFTAIINPPDACILAVGSIIQKPVVKNGAIVVGNTMKVTLSCDHRVVDGATGAQFLQTLKSILEHPVKMLV